MIFASEMLVGNNNNASSSTTSSLISIGAGGAGGGGGVGSVGVWNGTDIKLFMVREGVKEGPTLMRPKGAVDAVGSRIVQGIGGLRLGSRVLGTGGAAQQQGNGSAVAERSVREV